MSTNLLTRTARATATGLLGAVAYDGLRKVVRTGAARRGTVTLLAWGLRGRTSAEVGAERVRLATGDLLAEARERVGEEAPPPVATEAHGHH